MNLYRRIVQRITNRQVVNESVHKVKPLQEVIEKIEYPGSINSIVILPNNSIVVRIGQRIHVNHIKYRFYQLSHNPEEQARPVLLDQSSEEHIKPEIHLIKTSIQVGVTLVQKDKPEVRILENVKRIMNVIIYGPLFYKVGRYEMKATHFDAHMNVHRKKLVIFVPSENKLNDSCTALFATDSVVFTDKFWYDLLPAGRDKVPVIKPVIEGNKTKETKESN